MKGYEHFPSIHAGYRVCVDCHMFPQIKRSYVDVNFLSLRSYLVDLTLVKELLEVVRKA